MARQALNSDKIITEALALIEEEGFAKFSMHRLATRLNIKTASLYNHVENVDQIGVEIGKIAIERLNKQVDELVRGTKDPAEILMQIAIAHRQFAHKNSELYKVMINLPAMHGRKLVRAFLDPMQAALTPFISEEQGRISALRAYRSMIHGFVSLEASGYFEFSGLPIDDSYQMMIRSFIESIKVSDR